MPVRIYDLAKKLGIESKVVLAKAKELGIAEAKVPSSSLDKITAEYLEDELAKLYPPPRRAHCPPLPPPPKLLPTARWSSRRPPRRSPWPNLLPWHRRRCHRSPPPCPRQSPAAGPILSAPPETVTCLTSPRRRLSQVAARAPAPLAREDYVASLELPPVVPALPPVEIPKPAAPPPRSACAAPPPVPKLGEKVGFVQLPQKPAPRPQADRECRLVALRPRRQNRFSRARRPCAGPGAPRLRPALLCPAKDRRKGQAAMAEPARARAGQAGEICPAATGQLITSSRPSSCATWPSN
jgi:translation initiation factor IF-2